MNLLVRNARIWTGDVEHPEATDVLIEDGRITAIGGSEVAATAPAGTPELDAAGRRVTPGFIDSHNHLRLGSGEGAVQLAGAKSIDEIRARIAAWLDENHDATWVHGEGFDYAAIPEGRHPRADDLDGATRGLPTMLLDYSVHAAWFNREALAALGADAQSPTAPFGTYEVDDATGQLTGYLANFATAGISRAGQAALERVVPAYSRDAQYARVRSALAMAARYGLTTVVEPQNSVDDIELFERARAEGVLHSRVVAALFHPSGTSESEIDELEHVIASRSSDRITLGPIKLYIDDIVEPHTAAMIEPYANRPDTSGRTYYEPREFGEVIARLDARGLQCFVHATGDRGIRVALDAFEYARQVNGPRDSRHQIVHVECLDAADIPRFAELGVVACMQPRHCAPEIVEEWRDNVGDTRWRYAWPMSSLAESGATLAFSSDWNVAEMNPMIGIYTAVTRASLDGTQSWIPQECISVEQALRAYTAGSAFANFVDTDRGVLAVGMLGDLVVLSDDILAAEPEAIRDTRVDLTVVGGQVVWDTR
ncbi:MAG: amidohydrolase [Actinobacteria bacterium]|nr:amidohydrolase [Actinomycetota bacterium]